MRTLAPFIPALLLLLSCGSHGQGPETAQAPLARDTNWMADLRITAGDTLVRICGSGKRYHLTGNVMDTIAYRYRYANTRKGQWMKLWCLGHLGTTNSSGHMDSSLCATKFLHLDASLHCDPVPDPRISGSYVVEFTDPMHTRSVRLDLFGDGSVTMYSDLHDDHGVLEEDGRWGMDAEDQVNVTWPQRDQTMVYHWTENQLIMGTGMGKPDQEVRLQRAGPVDRAFGMYGRTARWLASIASAQGHATQASDLLPSTPIASLFATEAERTALARSARDTLALDDLGMKLQWAHVSTVHDAVQLMRFRSRTRP